MEQITEGLNILNRNQIPFSMEDGRHDNKKIVRIPDKNIDYLRELGFRVGRKFAPDGRLVYFKGRLFGMIMG